MLLRVTELNLESSGSCLSLTSQHLVGCQMHIRRLPGRLVRQLGWLLGLLGWPFRLRGRLWGCQKPKSRNLAPNCRPASQVRCFPSYIAFRVDVPRGKRGKIVAILFFRVFTQRTGGYFFHISTGFYELLMNESLFYRTDTIK